MPNRENFHSEEVQDIMGKAPAWVIRWGVTVVFAIFGGILLGCYFIKYPDIIESSAEITTYNPPVELITRYEGLIDSLYVSDGDTVKSGDIIAVLENSSSWSDVNYVSALLDSLSKSKNYEDVVNLPWLEQNYNLGDLQSNFAAFQKSAKDYKHYLSTEYITHKKQLLNQQILKNKEYLNKQQVQYAHVKEDLSLQQKSYSRDSLLFAEKVISSADFEIASQNLIAKQNSESGFNASLTSTELQIIQLEQQLVELTIQQENETSEFERSLAQSYRQLIAEIAKWKQIYIITAPSSGKITFGNYWSENQHIKVGDKLASILPDDEAQVIGRARIPSAGFGKVKVGAQVNVKLGGYPYMEFGVLPGTISSLSAVPEQMQTANGTVIIYIAEITFADGLKTSYGKELPLIQQMDGTAEIITEDMRLISRFFNPIVSLFKNR